MADAKPSNDVHEVRQFLGLCNFFRGHVQNFAQITAPLPELTGKDWPWKTGPMPLEANKAFRELWTILIPKPLVHYPQPELPYVLITDTCQGDTKKPGGYGAILAQVKPNGEFQVISYASRKLKYHEKNYAPFLLEMSASVWAMNITLCIYEENTLYCTLTKNLWLTWEQFTPKHWTECRKQWTPMTSR